MIQVVRQFLHKERSMDMAQTTKNAIRKGFLDLLEQEMLSHGSLTALQITQNTMNVDMSGMTLDQISAMFARLRLSPIVDSVSLSVASTEEGKAATIMDFTVRIELRQPEEVSQ